MGPRRGETGRGRLEKVTGAPRYVVGSSPRARRLLRRTQRPSPPACSGTFYRASPFNLSGVFRGLDVRRGNQEDAAAPGKSGRRHRRRQRSHLLPARLARGFYDDRTPHGPHRHQRLLRKLMRANLPRRALRCLSLRRSQLPARSHRDPTRRRRFPHSVRARPARPLDHAPGS
ncbi:MAG: hypothetical protein RL077_1817 [Verrucomicrobiota bacterium]